MRKYDLVLFLVLLTVSACGTSLEQSLRPEQSPAAAAEPNSQNKKRLGLVVTDNPYMISSDRLEQMNKGGFGAY
jgi:hypothetical protein